MSRIAGSSRSSAAGSKPNFASSSSTLTWRRTGQRPTGAKLAGDPAESLGEVDRVHRLDDVEQLDGAARLVRLQRPDQVPGGHRRRGPGDIVEPPPWPPAPGRGSRPGSGIRRRSQREFVRDRTVLVMATTSTVAGSRPARAHASPIRSRIWRRTDARWPGHRRRMHGVDSSAGPSATRRVDARARCSGWRGARRATGASAPQVRPERATRQPANRRQRRAWRRGVTARAPLRGRQGGGEHRSERTQGA